MNIIIGPGAANRQKPYLDWFTSKPYAMSPQARCDCLNKMNTLRIPCLQLTISMDLLNLWLVNTCNFGLNTQGSKAKVLAQNVKALTPTLSCWQPFLGNSIPEPLHDLIYQQEEIGSLPEQPMWWRSLSKTTDTVVTVLLVVIILALITNSTSAP